MKHTALFLLLFSMILTGCSQKSSDQPALVVEDMGRNILLQEVFADCGHSDIVGREKRSAKETESELLKAYPGFTLSALGATHATLIKQRNGKCGEHYLFQEYKGKIAVFRENNKALLDVLDVSVGQLRKQDQKMLKDGISVYGNEECAAFWDDFGS